LTWRLARARTCTRATGCALAAAGLWLLLPLGGGVAAAHALVVRSEPAAGVALGAAPSVVRLWFSEPVQVSPAGVAVLGDQGERVDRLDAHVSNGDAREVDVDLADLAAGAYVVRWRATSADNHVVSGTTWFAVGFAAQPPPLSALAGSPAPPPPGLEVAGRWLVYASALVLVGARAHLPRAAAASLAAIFVLGQVVWLAAQVQASADTPGAVLLATRFGALWWLRLLAGLALAALAALMPPAWAWRKQAGSARSAWLRQATALLRGARGGELLLSSVLLGTLALGSHAAGAALPTMLGVLLDLAHLAAAALWIGALVQALLRLRGSPRPALREIVLPTSRVALGSMIVLLATGALSGWSEVQAWPALLMTAYGQALLLKLGLVSLILVLAALNLLWVRPTLARRSRRSFAGLVAGEIGLASGVLGLTGLLTSLPPPGRQPLPEPFAAIRQAGSLRVTLSADPNWVGQSHYAVRLTDRDGRPPADVTSVTLTFSMRDMNMGRTTVLAAPTPGSGLSQDSYEASGFFVGMPGVSEIGIGIQRSDGPDESAVFDMDVPDVAQDQFAGLRPLLTSAQAPPDPEHGQAVYTQRCQVCHGASGVGDGPAAASLLPPPSDLTLHARWHGDPQLLWFVANGVAGTGMPAFADELSEADRRDVVSYLHVLAGAAPPSPAAATPGPPPPLQPQTQTQPEAQPEPTAAAAAGVLSGRLVYGPDTDHDFWVIDLPDGRPRRITSFGRLQFPSSPAWSPDGQQIAYAYYELPDTRGLPLPQGTDVYVMDADGSGQHPASVHDAPSAVLQNPVWSPDGSALYVDYQAQRPSGELDVGVDRVDLGSGKRTRVVPDAVAHALSPDGKWLAYVRRPTTSQRSFTVWRSGLDGAQAVQLLGPNLFTRYSSLRFSPDGQRLVFAAVGQGPPQSLIEQLVPVAHADGDLWDLWTIDAGGANLHRLTAINEDLPVAAWSPDGRHLAFLGGGSSTTAEAGVSLIDTANGALTRLTTQPGHRGLDWSR
jgi:copper transport protein